jgi:nitroimidazol reductase NimA-like FMN-containing flavoprotein (pyridoxamine 5'-phosphate oxidase superfamily)
MSEQTKDQFDLSNVNRVRRISDRGHYDKETVFGIVDKALIAHVGFVEDGRPVVIPMTCARVGESLLIHGARKSRIMEAAECLPVCVTVTHVDALVYARSIFHSSMNYRSAVIHGTALPINEPEEKLAALEAMSEHLMPGRWFEVRAPLEKELKATQVMRININFASAKIRDVGVLDDREDYSGAQWAETWAGVLPLCAAAGQPMTDHSVAKSVVVPASVRHRFRNH